MNKRLLVILAIACLAALGQEAGKTQRPWWDDFPRIVQTGKIDLAGQLKASAVMCGAADDPTWGLYGQRVRITSSGARVAEAHAAGMRAMTWFEAFGTAGSCYVGQFKKGADGGWIKYDADRSVTRIFLNHWAWQLFDGTGEVRWVGVHNYFDDEDFARPYTRTHPQYGCPPMTYPDGTVATGYSGSSSDPRNSRIYDAGCAKDVFGNVTFSYGYNARVNERDPETGEVKGPTTGLIRVGEKYSGNVSPGKDAACPLWIDYARASVQQALDAGIDGLWCDNYSAWDDFHSRPTVRAFGEWSVATFRRSLADRFTTAELEAMGIRDVERFDVRTYLRRKCREWGGRPEDVQGGLLADPFDAQRVALGDRAWRDPRWLDDPVWRAYLIHKRRNGTKALKAYYTTIKTTAAAAGKPDFLVSGNDIPIMSLGWVRGDLDMVSTELAWGWGLASGRRGFMPPPTGSYVPVYKLAREHAKSRFVNVWMYVPKEQWHKPGIASVLYYQALANHTLPMPHPGNSRTVGDEASVQSFFDFVRRVAPEFGGRRELVDIGLYYSSSSQIMSFTPGGFRDHDDQRHMFAHWGWGTALGRLHLQYRAVPEWKLTAEGLAGLRILIVPNSIVFPAESLPVLRQWVAAGGRLIVTGATGQRGGEDANFAVLGQPALAALVGEGVLDTKPPRAVTQVGAGRVLYLREPIGLEFFKADAERPGMVPAFRDALRTVTGGTWRSVVSNAEDVPGTVGLVAYQDADTRRLFIDINNTNIDLAADRLAPAAPFSFTVTLPPFLRGIALRSRVLAPEECGEAAVASAGTDAITVQVPSVAVYASVLIEPR